MAESNAAFQINPWTPPEFEDEAGPGGEPAEPAERSTGEAAPEEPAGADFVPGPLARLPASTRFDEEEPGEGPEGAAEPDFATIKFLRENTLLSNAEKYAASIREEAELYVAQMRGEIDKLNREAEARYEEARAVKERSDRDAEKLISDAEAQVASIQEQARQEGLQAGEGEGTRRRYEEAGPFLEHMQRIVEELSQYRKQVAYYAEKDAIRLAVILAKKVLWQDLKLNKKAVWTLLAKTLATLEGLGTFKVWLSPQDFQFAKAARPSLERFLHEDQALTFRAKPDLPPGNVQIESDREMIDLTFQNQFRYLEELLNQALAERETVVLKRPASATPSIGSTGEPPATSEAAAAPDSPTGDDNESA
jgi:flagellar assembly protein FliH